MDAVLDSLHRAAATDLIPAGGSLLLAVSGGADSMALLMGAVEIRGATGWRLSVGHVDHGWRGKEADQDVAFVADYARRLALPFLVRRRDARRAASELRLSPEAAARHVRYAELADMAREIGASRIATAHQRDDAVESLLLARSRRGGLARLAGPRERRDDGVVRPLLSVSRKEILGFLSQRAVGFRRDATNGNLALPRNRIRRELAAAGEHAVSEIAHEVVLLAQERTRLDQEYTGRIAPGVRRGPDGTAADAVCLARCPPELQRLALERLAAPFARPGRAPMTGREREQIRALLASGADFRFEAGRRIRFERRGSVLWIRPRATGRGPTVYDSDATFATPSVAGEQRL
ncbi:MAG: tRNA lysidine(34) synthetase TilS [Acidobacteriota bacterium]